VGANLYEVDTDARASVQASAESMANTSTAGAPTKVSSATAAADATAVLTVSNSHRTPSIRFLGKDGWRMALSHNSQSNEQSGPQKVASVPKPPRPVVSIPPMFGRPAFSAEEIEALILGGASVAPKVVSYSGGAKFKY
jgi:hypothetical protein